MCRLPIRFHSVVCAAVLLGGEALHAAPATVRDLGFAQRLKAQEAIERVYYSHQIDATAPFEAAVPRDVLARKVQTYLRQSAALERIWHTPVTATMLRSEAERLARDSRMPDRLRELYAALGDDPLLIQECLARPSLVNRLIRNFFESDGDIHRGAVARRSWDDWWTSVEPTLDPGAVQAVASDASPLPVSSSCPVGDVWENGGMDDVPDPRSGPRTVWTGSLLLTWGGHNLLYNLFGSGSRYDPATDTWTPMSPIGEPAGRYFHTAIWTGSEMIVWGGFAFPDGQLTNTGGRYDPVTDTWRPTSTDSAPRARAEHSAVWTGKDMIVWGGTYGLRTGGLYDPATDTWRATSEVNAPEGRHAHTAIWTGSRMIVWGGESNSIPVSGFDTGGIYDPVGDTWQSMSTFNAPTPRDRHTAVWTGEVMIVWGGEIESGVQSSGGLYDPDHNTWMATSTVNAAPGDHGHTAVWTGREMLVWGGYAAGGGLAGAGGRYDPMRNSWKPMSTINAPSPRNEHAAVWTGDRMIVWGGTELTGPTNTGGRYDPGSDTWTPTFAGDAARGRQGHTAVWTGNLMLIWGGGAYPSLDLEGGRYDPAIDAWSPIASAGAPPAAKYGHTAVWSGQEMIVWGGGSPDFDTGGRYDPIGDTWRLLPTDGAPSPRAYHTAVWTGSRMVIWGGSHYDPPTFTRTYLDTGAAYDPSTDAWTPTSNFGEPAGRQQHTAVWTGSRMLVWGGASTTFMDSGGSYDPAMNTWSTLSMTDAPSARAEHMAVWTGREMIVWGGQGVGGFPNTGGRYTPSTDYWFAGHLPTTNAPTGRWHSAAVWTGDEMIVWGGWVNRAGDSPDFLLNDGGRFDPVAGTWTPTTVIGAPTGRLRPTAIWTGTQMIVWGGSVGPFAFVASGGRYCACVARFYPDGDGDGLGDPAQPLRACAAPGGYVDAGTDCNDADPGSWAAPGEVRDVTFVDQASLTWEPPASPGASSILYDVLRSGDPRDFVSGSTCAVSDSTGPVVTDAETPVTGTASYYLVRAQNACPDGEGPLGSDSSGTPRTGRSCP
ncbi:MAG TPA: hypothetical protein VGV60_04545 [Candidatus Polarisedimenticolia bacterium]|jgi:N-acetylneuraminic acid mutarotase|nr:hypothetical protein [Candidatus Polarisedimenticolia bacterium]